MLAVLHNPSCSKSNCALEYLEEHHLDFEIRDYREQPLDIEELRAVCHHLSLPPEAIVRKNEKVYKENFAGKTYNDEEWLAILAAHPILIQRPIIINENKAVIARPAERIKQIL